ncbi:MAG: hypothetical protein CMJ31_12085 [Phycisphaerae bacterium]|nr:hypothetical protein [Phycisphaerae bacterium]
MRIVRGSCRNVSLAAWFPTALVALGVIAAATPEASAQQRPGGRDQGQERLDQDSLQGRTGRAQPRTTRRVQPALEEPEVIAVEEAIEPADGAGETMNDSATPTPERTRPAGLGEDEEVTFGDFSEPLQITELINLVASLLEINISVDPSLSGQVVFNRTHSFKKSELLPLLDALLERFNFTITYDSTARSYIVEQVGEAPVSFEGDLATTRVIRTPFVRPSTLQTAIEIVAGDANIAYLDEIGVLIARAPQRALNRIEDIVERILAERDTYQRYIIPLENIAASVARERALALAGGGGGATTTPGNQANRNVTNRIQQLRAQQAGGADNADGLAAVTSTSLDNLAERLAISPTGNSLIFNGTFEEFEEIDELVQLIDEIDTLEPKEYYAGETAQQVAEIARKRGLGEVIFIESPSRTNGVGQFQRNNVGGIQNNQFGFQDDQDAGAVGGPLMVVYEETGSILYYGTEEQQVAMERLITELETDADRIVIRTYKLNNSTAEDVAAILESIITGQTLNTDNPLLPSGGGAGNVNRQVPRVGAAGGAGGGDINGSFDPNEVFVTADVPNNQIVVRAPVRSQADLERLILQLDLRRKQVYLEAQIVSVADNSDFNLTVETQIAGAEYAFQNLFGLSSANPSGDIRDPRIAPTGLQGLTTAVIQSNYLPLVINAIQTDTDSRVISTPQVLVNDNEEAAIVSLEEQPTTSVSQGDGSTITSFEGFQEAGTNLTVTPTISDAGFLRLQYDIELSSFIGAGSGNVPAPRQTQRVTGSATVPSDATIVIGGITVDSKQETIAKLPIIGDIPLLGLLFSDTNKNTARTKLYVFITPRVMVDPSFRDLKLFTKGPQAAVEVDPLLPEMHPEAIELIRPTRRVPEPAKFPLDPDEVDRLRDEADGAPINLGAAPAREERDEIALGSRDG